VAGFCDLSYGPFKFRVMLGDFLSSCASVSLGRWSEPLVVA
jgi:hypothetical protein